MRTPILILASITLFSSCSKYQYMVVSSDDTPFVKGRHFQVENDTFRIVYNFSGYGGPLQVAVVNKSKGMMEVDWEKSFFITGDKSRPLFRPSAKIEGEIEPDPVNDRTFSLSGQVRTSAIREYIPPATSLNRVCGAVSGQFINTETYKMRREKVNVKGFSRKIRRVSLEKNESPVVFRVYLTLGVEKGEDPVIVDRSFYVSELIATKVSPDDMPPSENNVATVSKFTRGGGVLAAVGGLGAILLLGYLAAEGAGD
jgi:hypothetical protein